MTLGKVQGESKPGKVIISFSGASFAFPDRMALEEISMDIREGEFVGVIGPNGSGKTTLLKAILGLIHPVRGSVQIFDCACEELRCHHRARIGYLPQKGMVDPRFPIRVEEVVAMGRYSAIGLLKRPRQEDRRIVQESLQEVGMVKRHRDVFGTLSGGQQQRVLIARALAQRPQVLLLDEPTTGIDTPTQHSLIDLIRRLHREHGLTIVFVTHDVNMISPHVDSLALLSRRLYGKGPPDRILTPENLTAVYGQEVIITERNERRLVILGDHHHQ